MKQFISALALVIVLSNSATAQTTSVKNTAGITNFKATIDNNNLLINWTYDASNSNYWEVQGSIDGKSFTTIGMVMGGMEGEVNPVFRFKQNISKLKPGLQYYRILHIDSNETAKSSGIIQSAK